MPTQVAMARAISDDNEMLSTSPSSPEFLLPAFESNLQLSSSPILEQAHEGCLDPVSEQLAAERSTGSRLRRFSRGHTPKKLTRSPSIGATQADTQSLLDATDVRKFKKAEQRLTQSIHYLCKKYNQKNITSVNSTSFVTENVVGESTSIPLSTPTSPLSGFVDVTSPTSPNTTPSRRSRLVRAFSGSPVISPNLSPSSPRTQQATPRSRNGRRWSQALHAIMSPSPSLPRTTLPSLASVNDITWAEATNSSPNVSVTEVSRWEMSIAVESTRSAQSQLIKIIREVVAKLDSTSLEKVPEMKECVLFLAQFIYCGGRIPDVSTLDDSFEKLRYRAVKLCKSLSRLRGKEFSLETFGGRFKQPAILCHCLMNPHEGDTDVFGLKSPITKNDVALPANLRHFVLDYSRFAACLRDFHTLYRLERRTKRRERRLARIEKATALFKEADPASHSVSAEAAEIATLSTQELLQYALQKAMQDELYSAEDIEVFDPRLMLTLPRLAVFYGIRQSAFPTTFNESEPYTVPMEVFLPRICRTLSYRNLVEVRNLADNEASALASRLAGVENTADSEAASDDLYRVISTEANAGSFNSRDPRSNKLLSRALALHMSDSAEDFSMDDDSTISKAYIMLMGLAAS